MSRELILGGALANVSGGVTSGELLSYLVERLPGIDFYQLKPMPGGMRKAALDWQSVIGTTASLLAIGKILGAAYRKFVKPIREKNPQSGADLFVVLRDGSGNSAEIMIGKDCDNEVAFVRHFEEQAHKLEEFSIDKARFVRETHEFMSREEWVKIEIKSRPQREG